MTLTSDTLDTFGLGQLGPLVEDFIRQGHTQDELNLTLYDPSTPIGKVVDQTYPEIQKLLKSGQPPISVQDASNFHAATKQLVRQYGLPTGFFDTDAEISDIAGQGVSLSELNQRIQQGYVAVASAPQEVKDALLQYDGIDQGHLAAYFLDPTKSLPLLQQTIATAQIGGAATRTGFGQIDKATADQLQAEGVSDTQAQSGFQQLAGQKELMTALPGENVDSISTADQLAGTFGGNAAAARRIADRARTRQATFQQGGGFAQTNQGFAGIG